MRKLSLVFVFVLVASMWAVPAGAGGTKPSVSVTAPVIAQQGTRITVDVSIDKAPGNKVTVRVDTEDGTAKAGIDYVPASIDVTFTRRGPREVAVPLTIMSNPSSTTTRTFNVELGRPTHANIGTGHATIAIAPPAGIAAQSDLVRALNDETRVYDSTGQFDANTTNMKAIDPALDWGGRLYTIVGNSAIGVDDIVCLQESAPSGVTYSLAYIVHGASAGVYSAEHACPVPLTEAVVGALGRGWFSDSDVETQSELRRAMFDEFYVFTFHGAYDSSVANMKALDPFLDWGGRLVAVVGNSSVGVNDIVCLQQSSASGNTFSVAQIAHGPNTGTYFGSVACAALPTEATVSALGSSW